MLWPEILLYIISGAGGVGILAVICCYCSSITASKKKSANKTNPTVETKKENKKTIVKKDTKEETTCQIRLSEQNTNLVKKSKRKIHIKSTESKSDTKTTMLGNQSEIKANQSHTEKVILHIYYNNKFIKNNTVNIANVNYLTLNLSDCTCKQLIECLFKNELILKEYIFKKFRGSVRESTKFNNIKNSILNIDVILKNQENDILEVEVKQKKGSVVGTYFLNLPQNVKFDLLKTTLEEELENKYVIIEYKYDNKQISTKDMQGTVLCMANNRTSGHERPHCFLDMKVFTAVVITSEEFEKSKKDQDEKAEIERLKQENKAKREEVHKRIKNAYSYEGHERDVETQELVCRRYDIFEECNWEPEKIKKKLGGKYDDLKLGDDYNNFGSVTLPSDKQYLEYYILSKKAGELGESGVYSRPGTPRFVISSDKDNRTVYFSNHYSDFTNLDTGKKL